jgi:hypothetical protein
MEERAILCLREALAAVPFAGQVLIERKTLAASNGAGFAVTVQLQRSEGLSPIQKKLLCRVRSSGQPRIAREACLLLAEEVQASPDAYPVLIAPYFTAAATAVCDRYKVGYLDFAGNRRLAFDNVFIQRERFPNVAVAKRELRSLYSPKAERVLRVLLAAGPRVWRTQALADAAGVSLGQVASVKKLLSDREWIDSGAMGFCVAGYGMGSPDGDGDGFGGGYGYGSGSGAGSGHGSGMGDGTNGAFQVAAAPMISEWAANYRGSRNEALEFYSLKSVPEIETDLAEMAAQGKLRIVFTGFSAAARFAPSVRYPRVTAYVDNVDDVAAALGLKRVSSGANVVLIRPYDEGVYFGAALRDGAPVVSAIQAYLDLITSKGRGEEAARAILEEVIQAQWR